MVGDFWCRRSMQKGDSWQALFFSIFLFSCLKSHRCFYIFLRRNVSTHASAVFAKHWHVRTEGHINRNFYCCGARNLWRTILMHALSIFFSFQKLSKTSKRPLLYIFAGDKSFRHLAVIPPLLWFTPKGFFKKKYLEDIMQFWEICQKRFARETKNFSSMDKRDWQLFFQLKIPFAEIFPLKK